MSKRIDVNLETLEFGVMNRLFEVGDEYVEELNILKAQDREKVAAKVGRKRRLTGERLREREPW